MFLHEPAEKVEVDVGGAKLLDLLVTDGDNGTACDWAAWAEAAITTTGGKTIPVDKISQGVIPSGATRYPFSFLYDDRPSDTILETWQATRTDMLPTALRQAFATMLGGRPGPVNLDVPFNVFKEPADVDISEPGAWRAGISPRSGGDPEAIRRAVDLLQTARRPLVYVGHGVTLSEASDELTTLAHRLRIPVIFSPNGFGALDMADPMALGFVGRNGVFHANEAARTCAGARTLRTAIRNGLSRRGRRSRHRIRRTP